MVSKISNFILFGIIIFTNGHTIYRQGSNNEHQQIDLKKWLQNIVKQGNYDVLLNDHEYSPGNHQEDQPNTRYHNEKYRNAESYKDSRDDFNYNNNQPSSQNLNFFLNKTPTTSDRGQKDDDIKTINNSENDNGAMEMLNYLDKTLKLDGNELELRCYGNRCGESKDDDTRSSDRDGNAIRAYDYNIINKNYNRHLRCNGKSCSLDSDVGKSGRDSLRCYGNKCSRKTRHDDRNERDDEKVERYDDRDDSNDARSDKYDSRNDLYGLRDGSQCVGDRCGRNRHDGERDNLSCIGDRCSRNRNDYKGRDTLRQTSKKKISRELVENLNTLLEKFAKEKDQMEDENRTKISNYFKEYISYVRSLVLKVLDLEYSKGNDKKDYRVDFWHTTPSA